MVCVCVDPHCESIFVSLSASQSSFWICPVVFCEWGAFLSRPVRWLCAPTCVLSQCARVEFRAFDCPAGVRELVCLSSLLVWQVRVCRPPPRLESVHFWLLFP